jgi:hypothetical protein
MVFAFAGKTVVLLTGETSVLLEVLFKSVDGCTARGGAPRGVSMIFLHIIVKGKLVILFLQLRRKKLNDLLVSYL